MEYYDENHEICLLFAVGCPPGEYYDVTSCRACPVSTYKSEAGEQECTKCPANTKTLQEGSRSRDKCVKI